MSFLSVFRGDASRLTGGILSQSKADFQLEIVVGVRAAPDGSAPDVVEGIVDIEIGFACVHCPAVHVSDQILLGKADTTVFGV